MGAEIQSEFFVAQSDGAAAIAALRSAQSVFGEALMVAEIRTVAEDGLWMSPQYGGPTAAFHFTWHPDQDLAERAAATVAEALAPFEARPHWGKVFPWSMLSAGTYPRQHDFLALVERMDPTGKFQNEWFDNLLANN
jgi:xylitol oxidase